MRVALALVLVPWLGLAAEPSPAQQLSTARSALAKAVQATRKSQPTEAELAAAGAALEALKKALAENAELEAKDAGYARAAKAARNDAVRQGVDLAIGKLNANAQHKGRVLTLEALGPAESALEELKVVLKDAEPLRKTDAMFNRFLLGIDGAVVRHEQGFDEHWTRILGERRQALTAAVAAFDKDKSEAARKGADDAAGALAALLDGTARAEARNAALRTGAEKARSELAAAKTLLRP
jgi:hypothetical protein